MINHLALTGRKYRSYLKFWKAHSDTFGGGTLLSSPHAQPGKKEPERISFCLSDKLVVKLNYKTRNKDEGIFVYLVAAFAYFLYKIAGERHMVIHSPHYKFGLEMPKHTNFVPLLLIVSGKDSWGEHLTKCQSAIRECYKYQNYPLELVDNDYRENEGLFKSNVLISFDKIHDKEKLEREYDIILEIRQNEDSLCIDMTYNKYCLDSFFALALEENLDLLLRDSLASEKLLFETNLKGPDDPITPLTVKNSPDGSYNIIEFIQNQTRKNGDYLTQISDELSITHQELDKRSTQLANYLTKRFALQGGNSIGILMENSTNMVISMLAVIKTGNAFVPLDPSNPMVRNEYCLHDSKVNLLILTSEQLHELPRYEGRVFAIDVETEYLNEVDQESGYQIKPNDPVYVIYTSGTSGQPKGVVIEHSALSNYCQWFIQTFKVNSQDSTMALSSFTFDLSYTSLWASLISGASIHFPSFDYKKRPDLLIDYLREHKISYLKLTPSLFHILIHSPGFEQGLMLRLVILGGEEIRSEDVKLGLQYYPEVVFVNHYGPTETTIGTIFRTITSATLKNFVQRPVIGSAIDNNWVFVLDEELSLTPLGIPGEIYVGGSGLARGYLNRPELTHDRFLNNPHLPGTFIYRTGDRARLLKNGTIEFLGRQDQQVKIRGYRIELSEIEQALLKCQGLHQTVVVASKDGQSEDMMTAYYVGKSTEKELRKELIQQLPEYMVPNHIIAMENIPLTRNGKVDIQKLTKIQRRRKLKIEPPSTPLEEQLVELWKEVLELDEVGTNNDFFELGGHSLKGVHLVTLVHQKLDITLTLNDIFTYPTIAGISKQLSQVGNRTNMVTTEISQIHLSEDYEVSHSQKRVWIMDQVSKLDYIQSRAYLIEGNLNQADLSKAWDHLVEKHESLRTNFVNKNGQIRQLIHTFETSGFQMQFRDFSKIPNADKKLKNDIEKEGLTPFDLARGPLLKVRLYMLAAEKYVLQLITHHIVSDAYSMGELIREIFEFYTNLREGKKIQSEPLRIHYKDYAAWQNDKIARERVFHHNFWKSKLDKDFPKLNLPLDRHRPLKKTGDGRMVQLDLGADFEGRLKHVSENLHVSQFNTLSALVLVLLHKLSAQEDVTVGFPVAGRNHPDLIKLIGIFVNALPLRMQITGGITIEQLIRETKNEVAKLMEHHDYPLDALIEDFQIPVEQGRSPLFDVMVQWLDESKIQSRLPGIRVTKFMQTRVSSTVDLYFHFKTLPEGLQLTIIYDSDLFDDDTIEFVKRSFVDLGNLALKSPSLTIKEIFKQIVSPNGSSSIKSVKVDF